MSLRLRLTIFITVLVAAAVIAVSWAAYASARNEARGEIDTFLHGLERIPPGIGQPGFVGMPHGRGFAETAFGLRSEAAVQVISADGTIVFSLDDTVLLPVDDADLAVAAGDSDEILRDVRADGIHYRMITRPAFSPLSPGEVFAVQIARDLSETDALLADLRNRLILIGLAAAFLTALASWFVARRALRPVAGLTVAAEQVAATRNLEVPIEVDRKDEIGRLAAAFNTMLAALATSHQQQRRLVADAGHELRTPLTSLRTNIEVLARARGISETDRAELLADATHELAELSVLVGELVDLAYDAEPAGDPEPLDLAELVADSADRFRRRSGRRVEITSEPCPITGRPSRLARAVANLLDNAAKWGPADRPVEVSVAERRISVRDHGPGIDRGDLPHVFERFYRADAARTLPGSGLGLSIVEQVAREHGGAAFAENHPEGGAVVGFEVTETPTER